MDSSSNFIQTIVLKNIDLELLPKQFFFILFCKRIPLKELCDIKKENRVICKHGQHFIWKKCD